MSFVLSSISGNLISAASAGYAPTNSGDVSAIASAYQVVSATATQLYAGMAYLTSVNGTPVSASRAGNAANALLAASAWYDGTGRFISALPDSAAVSAIASAYTTGKQDTLTFAYNTANQISSINGSALGGMNEAAVSGIASAYAQSAASSKLDASASSSFYSTANESGFITGVDLSPYQTTAGMSGYMSTSMSSDFQQVTGMSSYVPYSSIGYNTASAISGINGSALAGTTYSAGTGIDITDDVISVEAPVDIVAGPGIVIDNPDGNTLRVSQSTFGAWEDISSQFTWASNVNDNHIVCLYNSSLKLLYMQGFAQINVGTSNTQIGTLPNNLRPIARVVEICTHSTLEEKHGVLSTNEAKDAFTFKWITQPSNKYAGVFLITPVEEI